MNMRQIARARHWRERYSSALFALFVLGSTPLAQADGTAILLDLEGAIGVATAEYIINGIEEAEDRGAELVIIRMDTPGGLVNPMRDIVKAILGSDVPVATYVSPDGARADSAGTYILLASHIAAMAPTTHLGAATPVALGGGGPGKKDGPDDKRNKRNKRNKRTLQILVPRWTRRS
jgi:membrane-bound serine protease (ClpP class)